MRVSRWWHNFHFLVCIIKHLMCIIDRLLQYTIIFYFSLSFLLSLYPLIKLCLWFFSSFSTAPVSSSSLQKCICPLPLLFLFKETENHLAFTFFFCQNYFQKMRLPHLHTIYVDKTRSARAICVFDGLDFSCCRRHASLCC